MSPGLIHGKTACEKASRGTAGEETPKNLSEPAISRRANVANQEEWFGQIPIPLVPRRGIGDTTTLARRSMVLSPGANLSPVTVPSGATFQPVDEYGTNCPGSLGGAIEPTWWPAGHMKCGTLGTAFRSFDRLNMNQLTLSQSSPGYKGMARLTESPLVCTRYLRLQIPGAPISQAQRSAYFCDFGGRDMFVYRAKYGAMGGISRSNKLIQIANSTCVLGSLGGGIEPCAWQFLPPPLAGYR